MVEINAIAELSEWRKNRICYEQKSLALVPTMGYLHEGHLSLVEQARKEADLTAVSIFVNPAQFNDPADLEKYPRYIERDISLLQERGVDLLFAPPVSEVYPNGLPEIKMEYPDLTSKLCGVSRPGHFSGMLTIVHNLLLWMQPDTAIFGLKDYQQYLLIRKMARDLALPVRIKAGELVREPDGLAMSSRNVRLSPEGRSTALRISRALFAAKSQYENGQNENGLKEIEKIVEIRQALETNLEGMQIDYAGLYHALTLEPLFATLENGGLASIHNEPVLIAIAAYVEGVRLIDNILLNWPQESLA